MKINQNKLTRAGLILAAVGMMAGLGGCGSIQPKKITEFDKTGKGIVYAVVPPFASRNVQSMCDLTVAPGVKDDRCQNSQDYDGVWASMVSNAGGVDAFPVLIPKNLKVKVDDQDIIKVQLVDNAPAHFLFIANKGSNGPNCYNHVLRNGGVVCPKYSWDYRDYAPPR